DLHPGEFMTHLSESLQDIHQFTFAGTPPATLGQVAQGAADIGQRRWSLADRVGTGSGRHTTNLLPTSDIRSNRPSECGRDHDPGGPRRPLSDRFTSPPVPGMSSIVGG